MAGRVFISYRRADTAQAASWLSDRLAGHYGRPQVVTDLDPTQLGHDFAGAVAAAVASSDVLVLLIGHQWLTATGPDGNLCLADPNDFVRLEIESALARGVPVVPVLVDGAKLPLTGELPPSLAALPHQQALQLSPGRREADTARLLQVLDQNLALSQATRSTPVSGQPTATARRISGPRPRGTQPTRPMPRRRIRTRTAALIAGGIVVVAVVAFVAIPRGHPAASGSAASHHGSSAGAAPPGSASPGSASPSAAAQKVLLADDFSTGKTGWVDDAHRSAGAYTPGGAYRLSVTGADGQSELARPAAAGHGLGGVTSLNLSVSVDARKIAGAAGGYGYGLAFRADGSGDYYAFVIEDHAVAIQKWVGNGAQVADSPAPVSTSAVHAGAADRLRAVCATADGGRAVHLELWLNGAKLVDYTDHDHPYTTGYLGLFVESISDGSTTAGAEFDNFAAAQP